MEETDLLSALLSNLYGSGEWQEYIRQFTGVSDPVRKSEMLERLHAWIMEHISDPEEAVDLLTLLRCRIIESL